MCCFPREHPAENTLQRTPSKKNSAENTQQKTLCRTHCRTPRRTLPFYPIYLPKKSLDHHCRRTPLPRLGHSFAYKLLILALKVWVPPAQRRPPLGYVLHRPLHPQPVELRRGVVVRGDDVEVSKADAFQHVLHSLLRSPRHRGLLKQVICSQASMRPPGPANNVNTTRRYRNS